MRCLIVFVCIALCAMAAEAQFHTLSGIVRAQRDLSSADGVTVWAEGALDTAISDSAGQYSLSLLNGTYSVHFQKAEYCPLIRPVMISGFDVDLAVELSDPRFVCSVTSLVAVTWPNHDVTLQFSLSDPGGLCPLEFTISDTSEWLSCTPAGGAIAPDGLVTINVFMDEDYLDPPGIEELLSVLRIDHGAPGSPYIIPVSFYEFIDPPGEADDPSRATPASYEVAAYPNPFNAVTTISFSLPVTQDVELGIFDIAGRRVASPIREVLAAGEHRVTFDGAALASGIYFVRLEAGEMRMTRKVVLLK